jgi:hypothetical protein
VEEGGGRRKNKENIMRRNEGKTVMKKITWEIDIRKGKIISEKRRKQKIN